MCSTGNWKIWCSWQWGTTEVSCPQGWGRLNCREVEMWPEWANPACPECMTCFSCQWHSTIPWLGFQECLQTPFRLFKRSWEQTISIILIFQPGINMVLIYRSCQYTHTQIHTQAHPDTPTELSSVSLPAQKVLWSVIFHIKLIPCFLQNKPGWKVKLPECAYHFGGEELLGRSGNFQDNESGPDNFSLSRLFEPMCF